MKNHPPLESLSALVDLGLGTRERARVEAHLKTCAECSNKRFQLHRAAASLSSLPEAPLTDEERRNLQAALAGMVRSRPAAAAGRRWKGPWLAPGLAAATAVAAVAAWFSLSPGPEPRPAAPEVVASGRLRVDDASGIRRVVSGLPQVRNALGRYPAGVLSEAKDDAAAGIRAERSLESTSGARGPGAEEQADSAAAPESASAPHAAPAMPPEGGAPQAPAPAPAPAQGFSRSAGLACLNKVAAMQEFPVLPLVARKAEFRGQPAWLLTYAWTSSKDPQAKLDQIQVWVVSAPDCANFSGPGLLNRVLHYSAF